MSLRKLFLVIAIVLGISVYSQEKTANPFTFKWDNGFKLTSADSLYSLKFGGSLFIDHGYFHQNTKLSENFGPLESKSGTEIRRARLFFSGTIYKNTNFEFQVDFSGEEVTFKDAYIGISDIPAVGNFQIGHFKEPFRLSALTSGKNQTFMEGGANGNFSQSRNNGAMVLNDFFDNRLSAQLGAFRNANNDSNDAFADDGYVVTGRVTGIPYKDSAKKRLLHIGAAYSYRKPDSKEYKISISPGSHLAEKYVKTGTIEFVDDVGLANFELAYIHGSFAVQSEYLMSSIHTLDYTHNFSNYYTELSYFITGESKKYDGSYEGFGRIKPKRNLGGPQEGFGALEVAFIYSNSDLNANNIAGGNQQEVAVGLNWYLNPATRMMVNYVRATMKNQGNLDILQARFQIDF